MKSRSARRKPKQSTQQKYFSAISIGKNLARKSGGKRSHPTKYKTCKIQV